MKRNLGRSELLVGLGISWLYQIYSDRLHTYNRDDSETLRAFRFLTNCDFAPL